MQSCTHCVLLPTTQECTQDLEAFGFEQSKKSYSLEAFGEKANQFKSFYFRKHPTVSSLYVHGVTVSQFGHSVSQAVSQSVTV